MMHLIECRTAEQNRERNHLWQLKYRMHSCHSFLINARFY